MLLQASFWHELINQYPFFTFFAIANQVNEMRMFQITKLINFSLPDMKQWRDKENWSDNKDSISVEIVRFANKLKKNIYCKNECMHTTNSWSPCNPSLSRILTATGRPVPGLVGVCPLGLIQPLNTGPKPPLPRRDPGLKPLVATFSSWKENCRRWG